MLGIPTSLVSPGKVLVGAPRYDHFQDWVCDDTLYEVGA